MAVERIIGQKRFMILVFAIVFAQKYKKKPQCISHCGFFLLYFSISGQS